MSTTSNLRVAFSRTSEEEHQPPRIASTSPEESIESGDFRIDLHGRELNLTSEEFDVLVFLANHPRSVITPHTVLNTHWTTRHVRQTEFLRTLASLRDKLDAASKPGKHYLRTEPWVVYRFDATSSLVR